MKDKELDLDILENADGKTIERLSGSYKAVSDKDMMRLFERTERLCAERNDSSEPAIVVSGVEHYHRPVWRKLLAAASALVLVAGAAAGGAFMLKNRGGRPAETFTDTGEEFTDEVQEAETNDEAAEETETAESPHEFKKLQLHEPAQYAETMEEAQALMDEHCTIMQWDERHDYRVDTAYYTELLQREGYDLDSFEAKSYIYHMMCNSYLYFDTAKGTVSNNFSSGGSYAEFQVDLNAQECCHKASSVFDNGQTNTSEYYVYDGKMFDVYPDSMTYRSYGVEPFSEMKFPEDNYRYIRIAPPDLGLNYQPANSIMFAGGYSRQMIIPEGWADYWLNDFDKWHIDGFSERLGRTVAELSGVNNYGNDFRIAVDINTGIMVEHTEIISGTANTSEITSLEIDVPIERIEFDPSGYTEEKLRESSEIR